MGCLNDESSFQPEPGECYNEALAVVKGKIIFNSSASQDGTQTHAVTFIAIAKTEQPSDHTSGAGWLHPPALFPSGLHFVIAPAEHKQ
jgi:hypothetical protein